MVMYCDFEEGEEADPDMERVSLCCGHEFSACAWAG